MTSKTQFLVGTIILCSFVSVLILGLAFFTMPGSLGPSWAVLIVLQGISSYAGFRLYQSGEIKLDQIYKYLKDTSL